jgi:hypothetical protein
MTLFAIPTRDDMAPRLTQADRTELFYRALDACPDEFLRTDEALFRYLNSHGVLVTGLSLVLDAAIDEARANRKSP